MSRVPNAPTRWRASLHLDPARLAGPEGSAVGLPDRLLRAVSIAISALVLLSLAAAAGLLAGFAVFFAAGFLAAFAVLALAARFVVSFLVDIGGSFRESDPGLIARANTP